MNGIQAGWYPDGAGAERWWDGTSWTDRVRPAGGVPVPGGTAVPPPVITGDRAAGPIEAIRAAQVIEVAPPVDAPPLTPSPTDPDDERVVPGPGLVLGVGGLVLLAGSLLPWIAMAAVFGFTGLQVLYGLVPFFSAFVALGAAVQVTNGRLVRRRLEATLLLATLVLGIASALTAGVVGFVSRDTVVDQLLGNTDDSSSEVDPEFQDEVEDDIDDIYSPDAGAGIYVTIVGGLVVAGGAALALNALNRSAPAGTDRFKVTA